MKTFKLKGLNYFVKEVRDATHAALSFLSQGIGVSINDVEEFSGEIPSNGKIFKAV